MQELEISMVNLFRSTPSNLSLRVDGRLYVSLINNIINTNIHRRLVQRARKNKLMSNGNFKDHVSLTSIQTL